VSAKPSDLDIWLAIAYASETVGQNEKAISAFRRILALDSGNKFAMEGLKRLGAS
jgi:hypothetical protein